MKVMYIKEELYSHDSNFIENFFENTGVSKCPFHKGLETFVDPFLGNAKNRLGLAKEWFFKNEIDEHQLEIFCDSNNMTAKVCPGIGELIKNCIVVKSPVDIHLSIHQDGRFLANVPAKSGDIVSILDHSREQFNSKNLDLSNKISIKISFPLLWKPAHDTIFLQPQYHNRIPFEIMNGLVKKNTTNSLQVTTLIDLPEEGTEHHFIKRGTALCYLWSEKKQTIELVKFNQLVMQKKLKFLGGYVN